MIQNGSSRWLRKDNHYNPSLRGLCSLTRIEYISQGQPKAKGEEKENTETCLMISGPGESHVMVLEEFVEMRTAWPSVTLTPWNRR